MLQDKNIKTDIASTAKETYNIGKITAEILDDIRIKTKDIKYEWDKYNESLSNTEQLTQNIAKEFGGYRAIGDVMKESIGAATYSAQLLGITQKDLIDNQSALVSGLHTATSLSKEELVKFSAAAEILGKEGVSKTALFNTMIPSLLNVGYAFGNIEGKLLNVVNTATDYGVSVSSVYNLVQQNISKINEFAFENGVDGLTKMAAASASLKVDFIKVSETQSNLLKPEEMQKAMTSLSRYMTLPPELTDVSANITKLLRDPISFYAPLIREAQKDVEFDSKGNAKLSEPFVYRLKTDEEQSKILGPLKDAILNFATLNSKTDALNKQGLTIPEEFKNFIAQSGKMVDGVLHFALKTGDKIKELTPETLTQTDINQAVAERKRYESFQELEQAIRNELDKTKDRITANKQLPAMETARVTDINKITKPLSDGVKILTTEFSQLAGVIKTTKNGFTFYDTSKIGNSIEKEFIELTKIFKKAVTGEGSFIDVVNNITNLLNGAINKAITIPKTTNNVVNDLVKTGEIDEDWLKAGDAIKNFIKKTAPDDIKSTLLNNLQPILNAVQPVLSQPIIQTSQPITPTSQPSVQPITPTVQPTPQGTNNDVSVNGTINVKVDADRNFPNLINALEDPSVVSKLVNILTNNSNFISKINGKPQ